MCAYIFRYDTNAHNNWSHHWLFGNWPNQIYMSFAININYILLSHCHLGGNCFWICVAHTRTPLNFPLAADVQQKKIIRATYFYTYIKAFSNARLTSCTIFHYRNKQKGAERTNTVTSAATTTNCFSQKKTQKNLAKQCQIGNRLSRAESSDCILSGEQQELNNCQSYTTIAAAAALTAAAPIEYKLRANNTPHATASYHLQF